MSPPRWERLNCWACLQVPQREAFQRMLGLCYHHADPAMHFPTLVVPRSGVVVAGPVDAPLLLIPEATA